jgi:hypothetical protein
MTKCNKRVRVRVRIIDTILIKRCLQSCDPIKEVYRKQADAPNNTALGKWHGVH